METTEEPRDVQVGIKEAWRRIRTRLNARLQEGVATEFIGGSKPYDEDLETCNYYIVGHYALKGGEIYLKPEARW